MHFFLKARPMRRWRVRIFNFIFVTLTQKTLVVLINNSNISLLFPPDTFIVTFAGALQQALAYLVRSCHVAVRYSHENSYFAHAFKHCGLKTSDLSDWNANNSTICTSCVSERAFCSWVGSRPVHIHTLNEPYQSSFGSGPRPPLQQGLCAVVWCAPECDYCIHTCPNDPHQEGKRTWICFNRTKQDRW